jgi:hypothetical protein
MEQVAGAAQAGLAERFLGLKARHGTRVQQVIRRGKLSDPEAAEAEVWAKAWEALLERARGDGDAASGGGDNWGAWLAQAARWVVLGEARHEAVVERRLGMRAVDGVGDGGEGQGELVDESGRADPEIVVERALQMAAAKVWLRDLPEVAQQVVARWARGETDWQTAAKLGLRQPQVTAIRTGAIDQLRQAARRSGWCE